ncbi:MAG: serine/threonine-protein kinase [Streptosporangiaceae bacterium]
MSEYLLAGRYRLTDRIATGGMGEVWRAEDNLLNRNVAVKLLPTGRAGDEAFLARFRAEARYAASLSHPGIARVYDYGESSEFGGAYLVMELVEGDPLSAILANAGRLSPDVTLDIVSQSARALEAAHEAGIVHRDIKPGNLLVTADGTTKITDFGIATAVAAAQASHLTETGMVMGTAMYVSPEQATGSPVTAASDIYSLGVVAYECLAGRPPFTASEPIAIAYAHKHEPVPALPPDVPEPVADLVYHMLAKTPEERPASVQEVADRADMLRDALTLGEAAGALGATRADLPMAATSTLLSQAGRGQTSPGSGPGTGPGAGYGSGTGYGPDTGSGPGPDFGPGLATGPGLVPGPGHAQGDPRRKKRRRMVAGACTAAVCVLAAAIGVYLGTSHNSSPPTSNLGSNTTQHLSSPPVTPSASPSPSPSPSPSSTPRSTFAVQPVTSVRASTSPTRVRPTKRPSSPVTSPPVSSSSPAGGGSPTTSTSPSSSPTGTATSTSPPN